MTNDEFLDQLIRHEGVVPYAYQDSLGYWTIGVGRLIDKRKGGRLRPEEIKYLLNNDVDEVVEALREALPWLDKLTPNRKAVLYNMAFNLGVKGLLGFKNTLRFVEQGDYDKAADGMLNSKWASQVGKSPPSRRFPKGQRAYELSELMRNG
jgi:lysozyme